MYVFERSYWSNVRTPYVTWLTEHATKSFKLFMVFCVSKPVCLFLVLLVVSTPLIACALPGEEMTKAEQDCCLQMSDECGGSQMSDSHTCCTKTPQVEGSTLKASSKYSPAAPQAAPHASLCAAPEMAADRLPGPLNPCNDSPSPPGSISVLRI
ncbi:MAG TPA: hypothetical protein VGQ61_10185 [Candidatus Angelobacter sp.]|jgi:hypothetical protein|nr:hypothetical protein [Candidatus Angelobacter sp.]